MDVQVLIDMLTEGLPDDQKAVVTAAIQRDAVKAKAAGIKAQSEYDAIATERARLLAELDGDPAAQRPGSRAYQEWYQKNGAAVVKQAADIKAFEDKYGAGTFEKFAKGEFMPPNSNPDTHTSGLTAADVDRLVAEKLKTSGTPLTQADIDAAIVKNFQEKRSGQIANVLKTTGRIIQRHMYAGRKSEVDFDALEKIMDERAKAGRPVDIETAYAEWDKPEAEKVSKAARDKEVADLIAAERKKWDEEQQTKNANNLFPGGADAEPGALSAHRGADKFDRNALLRDMAKDFTSSGSTGNVQ